MSEQSRLFLALILSMMAIFLYNSFFVDPEVDAVKKARQAENAGNIDIPTTQDKSSAPQVDKSDEGFQIEESIKKLISRNDVLKTQVSSRVKVDSTKLAGSINLVGAKLDDITLKEHRQELDKSSPNVVLLSPQNTEKVYFIRTGFLPAIKGLKTPGSSTIWALEEGDVLSEGNPVTLSWDNGAGVIFKKHISIDGNYLITVKESVQNNQVYPISVAPFGLINQTQDMSKQTMFISHEGPIAVVDGVLEEVDYDDIIDDEKIKFKNVSGWAGVTAKYWISAIVPQDSDEGEFDIGMKHYFKENFNRFQVDILSPKIQIAPGSTGEYSFNIYAGAKRLKVLDKYEAEKNIPLFDHAIDFGWLYFLTRPIFEVLTYFNSILGNFGLAILLLTVCIRLILFPIANKSYNSMARMRKHMPEIQKLKERHSKDRHKLGQEMMKYYRDHKINPASGCLPLLIQIPVFFALYKVLYVTIEMRHAPFYGWIHDLSAPDPTNLFNLFGLIPLSPPEWIPAIGVLPLLFSLTMVLQQKLNPPPNDETQRMVMAWLPWIFLFLFAGFPAGLVLYWVWNNILSIIQQYIITKRIDEDKNA